MRKVIFGLGFFSPADAHSSSIAATEVQVVGQLFTKGEREQNNTLHLILLIFRYGQIFTLRNAITEEKDTVRNAIFPHEIGNRLFDIGLEIFDNFLTRLLNPSRSGIFRSIPIPRIYDACDGGELGPRSRMSDISA